MTNHYKLTLLLLSIWLLGSCASMTPLSPMTVNNTLPNLTKSRYISTVKASELIQSGKCKYLVTNRTYAAPMGLTSQQDLKNGAKGIDEWVIIDGGNAYELLDFTWVNLDNQGTSQLHLTFNTMICD